MGSLLNYDLSGRPGHTGTEFNGDRLEAEIAFQEAATWLQGNSVAGERRSPVSEPTFIVGDPDTQATLFWEMESVFDFPVDWTHAQDEQAPHLALYGLTSSKGTRTVRLYLASPGVQAITVIERAYGPRPPIPGSPSARREAFRIVK